MPLPNKSRNVFAAPVAKAYRPTMRDQVANLFSRALGDNYQSNELARGLFGSSGLGGGQGNLLGGLGLLDLTPIGAAFALEEAGRQIGGGQPVTGAANVALGMVPIPAAARAVKGGAKAVARAVLPNNLRLPAGASPPLDMSKAARMARAAEQGFNVPAYHSTTAAFDDYRVNGRGPKLMDGLGAHFGTVDAAEERLKKSWGPKAEGGNVRPEVLSIHSYPKKRDGSIMTEGELQAFLSRAADKAGIPKSDQRGMAAYGGIKRGVYEKLKPELEAMGFDGLAYINSHEGRGSISYVAFSPQQVRSQIDAFNPGGQARIGLPRPGDFRATGTPKPPTRRK
jgi:hypothetical protein